MNRQIIVAIPAQDELGPEVYLINGGPGTLLRLRAEAEARGEEWEFELRTVFSSGDFTASVLDYGK